MGVGTLVSWSSPTRDAAVVVFQRTGAQRELWRFTGPRDHGLLLTVTWVPCRDRLNPGAATDGECREPTSTRESQRLLGGAGCSGACGPRTAGGVAQASVEGISVTVRPSDQSGCLTITGTEQAEWIDVQPPYDAQGERAFLRVVSRRTGSPDDPLVVFGNVSTECTEVRPNQLLCPVPGDLNADLGGGDDGMTVADPFDDNTPVMLTGGAGADTLSVTGGTSVIANIDGGAGRDDVTITGGVVGMVAVGGRGADRRVGDRPAGRW